MTAPPAQAQAQASDPYLVPRVLDALLREGYLGAKIGRAHV